VSGLKRILYVDDDYELSEMVQEYLATKNFDVDLVHNPEIVIDKVKSSHYDLCLMDVKMPQKDGFELAEDLNTAGINIPFLFLTGQTRKEDRIKGLKLGAQDYVSKPFSLEELYLRISNIVTRTGSDSSKPQASYDLGGSTFFPFHARLKSKDEELSLSTTENELLLVFCQNQNQVVSRDDILKAVWGQNDHYKSLSLNVYISRLRKLLSSSPNVSILNQHGQGYMLTVSE
jgi:DNA-binding response OmpR family regulator